MDSKIEIKKAEDKTEVTAEEKRVARRSRS